MANMTPRAKESRRRRLLETDGAHCQLCGKTMAEDEITLDHITPKADEGSNDISNLRLACRSCNQGRHRQEPSR